MIRTVTSNTRNIIGHQVASLLAITKHIGDILCECQTSAVGIIASKNHIIIAAIRSQDRMEIIIHVMIVLPAGSAGLVTGAHVRDYEHLPSTGVIATEGTLLWQERSQSCYFKRIKIHFDVTASVQISIRYRILDLKYRA